MAQSPQTLLRRDAVAEIAASEPPLVVDLDGTLIRTDLLKEAALAAVARTPAILFSIAGTLPDRAAVKRLLAERVDIDPRTLPYDEAVLDRIREARAQGRDVYLASAQDQRYVRQVADHLGLFKDIFASDGVVNLAGAAKGRRLVEEFGEGGFDYIGNDAVDRQVWQHARTKIAAGADAGLIREMRATYRDFEVVSHRRSWLRSLPKMLRIHQWAKNALIFVPLAAAHRLLDPAALALGMAAFVAFSLCASSVYICNDLLDVQADRDHPSKKRRPFAAGKVAVETGLACAIVLLVGAAAIAMAISPLFAAMLALYYVATTAYSLVLKRLMLIDAVTLACLYAMRVLAGGAAVAIRPSAWLLAFCLFLFLSLALIKRYTELGQRLALAAADPSNRDYRGADLPVIGALAAAAGFNAVTIFTLYVSSDAVRQLYATPAVLWAASPVLIYWIGRMIMLAHRRRLHDDPLVFALTDPISLGCGVAMMVVFAGASL